MPVNLTAPTAAELFAVPGVRLGVVEAGIRKANRRDLTLMLIDEGASVSGVFTQNRFCAAPVQVCRDHLQGQPSIRALLINTGNANAGTGEDGLARARRTCASLAKSLVLSPEQILPFSTGVIMETLPVERIEAALPQVIAVAQNGNIGASGGEPWLNAALGIMTTDTVAKAFSKQIQLASQTVTITGISKGAGMIRPNMATMLGFVATDANVAQAVMPQLARALADTSFNRVTVDGDTSTNDSLVVIATNKAAHPPIASLDDGLGLELFAAMRDIAQKLAQAIVRDGEEIGRAHV